MMIESVLTRQGAAAGLHLPFGDKPYLLFLSISPSSTEPSRLKVHLLQEANLTTPAPLISPLSELLLPMVCTD